MLMKKWSDELIELSREYLNYDGVNVKSLTGKFGILNIDYQNQTYKISLLTSNNVNEIITFKSTDEIINAGWAVD